MFGIPDLRVFPDPYIGIDADRAKGMLLAERFVDTDFEGLIAFYYANTKAVPAKDAARFTRGVLSATARAQAALDWWSRESSLLDGSEPGKLLEIGCGTAPLLCAAAALGVKGVGIDIAFRWLVVGKKRLSEAGVNAPLICSCAEALPFPDETFDHLAADSVVEVVRSQTGAMAEAWRVLGPGGDAFLATPNRFSLGPDPHTGLWAGGYLPAAWSAAYARRRGAVPPQRQLLSARSLVGLLEKSGFAKVRASLPDVAMGQRAHLSRGLNVVISVYHTAKRLPVIRDAVFQVGPTFNALAEKDPGSPPTHAAVSAVTAMKGSQ
ncbi:MAG: class I SAM-dependent methyltransferase [Gemmatimonadaceae bacterium]